LEIRSILSLKRFATLISVTSSISESVTIITKAVPIIKKIKYLSRLDLSIRSTVIVNTAKLSNPVREKVKKSAATEKIEIKILTVLDLINPYLVFKRGIIRKIRIIILYEA
jgi:Asp-tRNA(Asn)/Glu-tRNA(Gln) amidotransferase C subunit